MTVKENKILNTITLLRFPFSILLLPVFLLSSSQCNDIEWQKWIWCFVIIHFLLYPASNGYNSFVDKDIESIGGIEKPPLPSKQLFFVTIGLDFLAVVLSYFFVNFIFATCILIYSLASRAYSSSQIRIKKYPIGSFFLVVFFQGAFTYFMTQIGISNQEFLFSKENFFILLATSFQIGAAYPITQIYQHKQDSESGIRTLSFLLGIKNTFYFSALMLFLSICCYFLYFNSSSSLLSFMILNLFLLPSFIFFIYWFINVSKNLENANFKNTMYMSVINAISLNCCFIILHFIK